MALITALLVFASGAMAQEFGVTAGVVRTDALAGSLGYSGPSAVDGKINWRIGGAFAYEFAPDWRLRTGLEYVRRHIKWNRGGENGAVDIDFEYLDLPLNVQYNFSPMVGVFGGLKGAYLLNDKVHFVGPYQFSIASEEFIPFADVGVMFKFNVPLTIELFYERSLNGQFAYKLSEFSEGGVRVGYWF